VEWIRGIERAIVAFYLQQYIQGDKSFKVISCCILRDVGLLRDTRYRTRLETVDATD